MHENIFVMQMICNAEDFKIKSLKPIPKKIWKNLINLKNPKHFPKTPIFRSKDMKMQEKEGLGYLPSEENLIKAKKSLRKRLGVKEKGFGRWEL